ncbi:MAG: S-layer homology domain-containing protein [Syntrophomonadaceae bacterium]|nr:S-layer homology domain-containing protein [Syntrophomonadaceae bacterium]
MLITLAMIFLCSNVLVVQAGPEAAFTVTLSVPECTLVESGSNSITYKLQKPVNPGKVYFRWDFSNGMDRTLEKDLQMITLINVDDNKEVKLDRGKPSDFQNFNGSTIEAGDFKYTKQGKRPEPKIRRVELTLKSTTLEPSKNYILKIGPKYEANNGNQLNKTYTWQFTTNEYGVAQGAKNQPAKRETKTGLKDIKGHWAESAINQLVSSGAISGYPGGYFKPDNTISRAEFATVMVKAFKLQSRKGQMFTDTANHWAKNHIATAEAYGIVSGYSKDRFGPDDPITREQMAVMITKAAGISSAGGGKKFSDSNNISGWARNAVTSASKKGIINGYKDNTFKPKDQASRAEAVTVITKALK